MSADDSQFWRFRAERLRERRHAGAEATADAADAADAAGAAEPTRPGRVADAPRAAAAPDPGQPLCGMEDEGFARFRAERLRNTERRRSRLAADPSDARGASERNLKASRPAPGGASPSPLEPPTRAAREASPAGDEAPSDDGLFFGTSPSEQARNRSRGAEERRELDQAATERVEQRRRREVEPAKGGGEPTATRRLRRGAPKSRTTRRVRRPSAGPGRRTPPGA